MKTLLLFLIVLLSGCLPNTMTIYQKNKKVIDDSAWQVCSKPPSPSKLELKEAINIAVDQDCITDKRITNIRCNMPTGSWEFYLEAEAPISSSEISHCYVYSGTKQVTKVNFHPGLNDSNEVPELNTHPDNRRNNTNKAPSY